MLGWNFATSKNLCKRGGAMDEVDECQNTDV